MLEAVSMFFIFFSIHLLDCYLFSVMIKEKSKYNHLLIIAFSMIDTFVRFNNLSVIQPIISNIITFLLLKIIYNKSMAKTLVGTLFIYLGVAIAEIIFSIIFMIILNIDANFFVDEMIGQIISNYIILLILFGIFKIEFVINNVNKVLNWCENNKIMNLIMNAILILVLGYLIISSVALVKEVRTFGILFLIILLSIIVFIFGYFNEKSTNNKLNVEFTQLLEYVKDYEKEVVEKGKRQHEYKNQLIVIDGMIPKTNKKLKKYVEDKIEDEKNINDNVWLEKLTDLPSGGIKGLIYYKTKKMLVNGIEIYVEVDSGLSDSNKWLNVEKYLEDYTRILGVYLDNAIEASINAKDKQIIIEFIDNEDNIEFIISNTYSQMINPSEMDKEKVSTKGKGRGYGLSLVKDIIEKNKLFNQSRESNGKFYVQKLTIKK